MLTYNSKNTGLTASITYNVQGPKLIFLSANNKLPDIYELPRNLVDFKISKTLGKQLSASLKIMDILNSPIVRSYKDANKYPLVYDRYQYGTNYVFALSYKF